MTALGWWGRCECDGWGRDGWGVAEPLLLADAECSNRIAGPWSGVAAPLLLEEKKFRSTSEKGKRGAAPSRGAELP